MLMQEERELVVEYGRKMSTDRLSTGTSGNISVCNAEKGLMAISPSGMDYFSTTPEDVVITDLEANIVDGVRKPSSEWALHTAFYRHKPHARAVVHTHSMYCTTFAVLGQPLRAVHYAIGDTGVLSSASGVRLYSVSLPSVDMCLIISEWRTGLSCFAFQRPPSQKCLRPGL